MILCLVDSHLQQLSRPAHGHASTAEGSKFFSIKDMHIRCSKATSGDEQCIPYTPGRGRTTARAQAALTAARCQINAANTRHTIITSNGSKALHQHRKTLGNVLTKYMCVLMSLQLFLGITYNEEKARLD
jgi:hypothetical protein